MTKTKIEWATDVWNPVTGCTKVSQGCKNCYAETIAKRFWGERKFTDVRLEYDRLDIPRHWRKPRRVFVNSMSDLFHDKVEHKDSLFVRGVFNVMRETPQHTYIVLTKRPENMQQFMSDYPPPRNVWLGVSVEDQKAADERIPLLLQTPATVRFVSCEPLLGPVDLTRLYGQISIGGHADLTVDGLNGRYAAAWCGRDTLTKKPLNEIGAGKLDWVICGGESGPGARPMHPDWARSLRDQCQAAGIKYFFKQWGEWAPDCFCTTKEAHKTIERPQPGHIGCMFRCGKQRAGRLLDGVEWNEYPGGEGC